MSEQEITSKEDKIQSIYDSVNSAGSDLQQRGFQEGKRPDDFGLCSKCSNFHHQRREYGTEFIACSFEMGMSGRPMMRPSRIDPIMECSAYYPVGQMDLYSMTRIATMIEVEEKRPIGFRK